MNHYASEIGARDKINQLHREAEVWRLTRKAPGDKRNSRAWFFSLRRRPNRTITA